MKITDRSGIDERAICTGVLTNPDVCAAVSTLWKPDAGCLRSKWANLIVGWGISHYQKYGEPIGNKVQHRFAHWSEGGTDEDTIGSVENLLSGLSRDWELTASDVNPKYTLDIAQRHFTTVAMERLSERMQGALLEGKADEAKSYVDSFRAPQLVGATWFDPLNDEAAVHAAWHQKRFPLVTFDGALGEFMRGTIARDSLVVFRAIAKAGKTFTLMDVAYRALLQHRKVAFFCVGDLSEAEVIHRWAVRLCRRPLERGTHSFPVGWENEEDGGEPIFDTHEYTTGLTEEQVIARGKLLTQKLQAGPERGERLRMSVHPGRSLNVHGMWSILRGWEAEGWIPDCFAEGSLVLTERGEIPIEQVLSSDRLWDGENWVSHGGLVYKGERDVITYAGLTATPDHRVFTEDGWRTLESCQRLGLRVAQTGVGGQTVRVGENYITDSSCPVIPLSERSISEAQVCVCPMHPMPTREMDIASKSQAGDCERVSGVSAAPAISDLVLSQSSVRDDSMYRSQTQGVSSLRGSRDSVPFPVRYGSVLLARGESPRISEPRPSNRPNRERRALRTGESPNVDTSAEHIAYMPCSPNTVDARLSHCPSCGKIRRRVAHENEPLGGDRSTNCGSVGAEKQPPKKRVWDLINAGPLHRFTVQGILVHNCVVVDYAEVLGDPPGFQEKRLALDETWIQLKAIAQTFHLALVTATQSDASGYTAETLGMGNFSGTRTQNDHADAIIGLNSTAIEKAQCIQRWNMIANRHYGTNHQIAVCGDRSIGCQTMISKWVEVAE